MVKLLYFTFFFLYLYKLLPIFADGLIYYILFFIGVNLFFLILSKRTFHRWQYMPFLAISFLWAIWFIFTSIANSNVDFSVVKQIASTLLSIALPIFSILSFPKLRKIFASSPFLELIVYCGAVQGCLSVVFFFNREILSYLNALFITDFHDKFAYAASYGMRGFGLAASVGGQLSAIQGIILILIVYLFLIRKFSFLKAYLFFLMVLPSLVLTGRSGFSGLVLSLLFLVFYLFWSFIFKPVMFSRSLLFLCLLLISLYFSLLLVIDDTTFSNHAFEFFHSQSNSLVESTKSTDVLINKMHFMVNNWTFLLGDGRLIGEDGLSYQHTDAGYMRQILLYGMPGLLMALTFYFYPLFFIFQRSKLSLDLFVSFLILFNLLILQLKDNIIFGSFVTKPYFWVTLHLWLKSNEPLKNRESLNK